MPSAATPAMSEAFAITTLWPMAVMAIVPLCLRLMVNLLHDAGTAIEPTLYCIASVPSMVVAQSLTTAAGFSVAMAPGAAVVAADGIAVVAAGAGAAAVAGAAGLAVSSAGSCLPQAARDSTQAAARRVILKVMGKGSFGGGADDSPCNPRIP